MRSHLDSFCWMCKSLLRKNFRAGKNAHDNFHHYFSFLWYVLTMLETKFIHNFALFMIFPEFSVSLGILVVHNNEIHMFDVLSVTISFVNNNPLREYQMTRVPPEYANDSWINCDSQVNFFHLFFFRFLSILTSKLKSIKKQFISTVATVQ